MPFAFARREVWLLAALALMVADPCAAQLRLPGLEVEALVEPRFDLIDNANRSHLDRVEQFLADGQGDEAVEILRRVMETDGDKLIPLPEFKDGRKTPFLRYYPVRYVCNLRLASLARLSPPTLALYRTRVDRIAERWLKQGIAERDPQQIERVAQTFFASSFGDDALWQLGELSLGEGRYTAARNAWERIHAQTRTPAKVDPAWPVPPGRPLWLGLRGASLETQWPKIATALASAEVEPNWLVYPDSDIPLADVRARLILVSIMEGNRERAKLELEVLRRMHADATGRIGGREGRYVDLLSSILTQSESWPAPAQRGTWPTFAGDNARTRVAPRELDPAGNVAWEVTLPTITSDREAIGNGRPRVSEDHRGLFSYHPIVWQDALIIPEHTQIRALRLADGQPLWPGMNNDGVIYRFPSEPAADEENEYPTTEPHPRSRPYVGVARMTLSLYGDKLFARMGSRVTSFVEPNPAEAERQGIIVGIDLKSQGRMLRGFPLRCESAEWNFEGTPVCDGANLYVGLRKHDQVNSQAHVACYDLASGELRWRRFVCAASTPGHGSRDELTHNLLTLAEGSLYYNTNLGCIAKLRTQDGALVWAVQYPRGAFPSQDPDRRDRHFFRDLNPCVVHQGMVLCAPSDTERIFGLDAATGQLIWSTPVEVAADVVHLLGVQENYLVASGDYIYWFDVFSGRHVGQFPPPQKDAPGYALPSPPGYGRGILAGKHVYWPTRERVLVFEAPNVMSEGKWTPSAVRYLDLVERHARGGNLLLAGDTLVISGAKKVQSYRNPP